MINNDNFIDFSEFGEFNLITQTKSTILATSSKNISPSRKYVFKIFQYKCFSPKDQKIILDTFNHVSKMDSQYLQCYDQLSFSYESKLRPTFSMKFISSKTLEQVLRTPNLLTKLSIENIMQCLFAVANGMSYLHNHLINHVNLCPSNIIIDEANQFYLCDFGLFPIKKLYIKEEDMYNNDYKDPYMESNQPTFINDVYSFGVLMCDIYLSYLQATKKLKRNENLQSFLKNNNRNKFDSFPPFCVDIIPSCLNSFASERPTFTQIVEIFKTTNQKIYGVNIQKLFSEFIDSNYLLNLASINDTDALNRVGVMYEEGKVFERNIQKALESYEKAANLNDSEAQNNFGVLLQKNAGRNKSNLEKGAHYLQLSAEQGNIQGMANYGLSLLNGIGVEKNFQKAEEYLKKAAQLGSSFAQVNYGYLLLDNNPTIFEINEALSYIKKAMNQNNPNAYYTFGILLQKGKFVEKNINLAMEHFKIAADMGLEKAMIEFANGNLKHEPKNEKIALKYFQLAFENGCEKVKDKIDKLREKLEPTAPKPVLKEVTSRAIEPVKQLSELFMSNDNYISPRKTVNKTQKPKKKTKRKSKSKKKEDDDEYNTESSSSDDAEYKDYYYNTTKKGKYKSKRTYYRKKVSTNFSHLQNQLNHKIPVKISSKIKLISLGEVVYDKLKYHSTSYIYPVGYQIEKEYYSIENPMKLTIYRGSVLNGGNSPIFRVECLDKSKKVFDGNTPSKPWRDVLYAIELSRKKLGMQTNETLSISGPSAYAFSMSTIINLIERLPNANRCIKYRFKKYFPNKPKNANNENDDASNYEENDDQYDAEEEEENEKDEFEEEEEEEEEESNQLQQDQQDQVQQTQRQQKQIKQQSQALNQQHKMQRSQTLNQKQQQQQIQQLQSLNQQQQQQQQQIQKSQALTPQQQKIQSVFVPFDDFNLPKPNSVVTNNINNNNVNDVSTNEPVENLNQSSNIQDSIDLSQSTENLIQQGDVFFEQNDLTKAFACYKEAVRRGNANSLLKCAEASQSFEEQLEYLELAIKEQIPMSFSKWRLLLMKKVSFTKDKDPLINFAKRLEQHEDFSDAAIVYHKAKDILNSQICYEKAKNRLDDIKDGYQQYSFAIFAFNHKELDLSKYLFEKALENNVPQAESKIEKLSQPKQQKTMTDAESLLEEGIVYYEGKNGIPKNFAKAMEFFEKASKLGCPKADFYIGYSIINEYGVEHLKRSADLNDPDGQNRYAHYLKNGILVIKDIQQALHYYKLAADQGHAEAAYEYGKDRYANGFVDEGIEYLKKSAEKLFPDAIYMYSKIAKDLSPEDAKKFFDFAIEKGSKAALKEKELSEKQISNYS